MKVKIRIRSTTGDAEAIDTVECAREGDVQAAVASALSTFRVLHPNNPPFSWILSVEKAGHA
jgi:hypothetical protein